MIKAWQACPSKLVSNVQFSVRGDLDNDSHIDARIALPGTWKSHRHFD